MAAITSNSFTTSGGKQYTYLTAGPATGPLVFFLHGWPGIALTWRPQIQALASLGFFAVAPDMPGYGGTWTSKDPSDFALEPIVSQILELLAHVGRKRAIWVGHDWGCGPLWAIASHHPEVCRAIIGVSVPFRFVDLGWPGLVPLVDRNLYPEEKYPYGQFDYMIFYEQHPEAATQRLESNIPGFLKLLFSRGNAANINLPSRTADHTKNGGWFVKPGEPVPDLPLEKTVLDQSLFDALVASITKNGYHGATSWYLNRIANQEYSARSASGGVLKMPVLFIHTEYDATCQTVHNPRLTEGMRKNCENLHEFVVKAGHWGTLECPEETNSGVVEFILKEARDWWPGPEVKNQK